MRVLGLDPGTAIMGWGVVDSDVSRAKLTMVDYGTLTTPAKMPLVERLPILYAGLIEVLTKYEPEVMSVEELFFTKNITTAISVGHARGVAMLASAHRGVPVAEYTPLQVKQAVGGYGRANKAQMQEMVRLMLGLKTTPQPDDAADGLALAICHIHSARFTALIEGNL